MPRQANGQMLPPANTAAVTATTISSTAYNTLENDICTEITNSLDRLGRSSMQAALPMGGNRITGMADPTAAQDAGTKAYIDALVASFFSTGDVKLTLKTTADSGWTMMGDQTIGSGSSGAAENGPQFQALFTLLFNNVSDTYAPIFTSGGGATTRAGQTSASAAWTANCRMSLTKVLGRALAISGAGVGLTNRALGQTLGEELHQLTQAEMASHVHANTIIDPGHFHLYGSGQARTYASPGFSDGLANGALSNTWQTATTATGVTINNVGFGSDVPHNNMQPSAFLKAMIKL